EKIPGALSRERGGRDEEGVRGTAPRTNKHSKPGSPGRRIKMFTTLFASNRSQAAQPRTKARTVSLGMEELEDRLTPSHGGLGHHAAVRHPAHHPVGHHRSHAPAPVAPAASVGSDDTTASQGADDTGATASAPTSTAPTATPQLPFNLTGDDLALDVN